MTRGWKPVAPPNSMPLISEHVGRDELSGLCSFSRCSEGPSLWVDSCPSRSRAASKRKGSKLSS